MEIKASSKSYEVHLEENLQFIQYLSERENALYVLDKNVYEIYKNEFYNIPKDKLILIEATEENKVIETALEICERLTDIPAKRNAVLISFGGGIIQDLTGFVANITYRGIHWVFVPTTLLAACDSCIGGKTSLNYKKYKNLLGTFYPPDDIYIAPEFFKTLTERDFKSGLGEVIKFNIMAGMNALTNTENCIPKLLARDDAVLNQFVESSLKFKKTFIELDEFDKGERIKLNFAHTFGHAIEVVTSYEIPHGTAVAIGMIMADYISLDRGLVSEDIIKRMEKLLLSVIDIDVKLLQVPLENYIAAVRKDKKQTSEDLTAVLIVEYLEEARLKVVHDIQVKEIEDAIGYFIEIYEEYYNEN